MVKFELPLLPVAVFVEVLVEFDRYRIRTNPNNNLMMRRADLSCTCTMQTDILNQVYWQRMFKHVIT